ncbi:predicted protein [Naegleria gruberi]|uniref:Predicted protein n=1 Tax=Naegleria gruberi TaxID=5762 RepID=D2W4Y7_NAEGR|nr:uncharacterized protein NAEGRDRAFT_76475 [Naegleria gruberi]EFC35865.1 predicted protein [Naegleria gruberi]|eukprot:XP_002668609.1 predicted protein [Naegleria gruberi strain NEG-M]
MHVCSTYFEKSITKLNQDERKLLFKIIFDAMGWKISKHKNKLSKYRGVFRTIASNLKKKKGAKQNESVKKKKTELEETISKKRKEREENNDSGSSSCEEETIEEDSTDDMSDDEC